MIAMSASVTVSIGELTTGDANLISRVSCVARLTCSVQCVSDLKATGCVASGSQLQARFGQVPHVPQNRCVQDGRSHRHMCR